MINVRNLSKTFKLYDSPADRLKEIVFRRTCHRTVKALKNVSFEVAAGETVGIVGQNGAGKSTLLKALTGVLLPDTGKVDINGRITGLLELGTGFNYEFTGRQNIYLNGTLLGMSRAEIDDRFDTIIAFTELERFINEPLKAYSSGMVMRLAFSIAIHADPRAFVVDEALAVGDAYFQQKCFEKIKAFKNRGGSIILVSHDLNAVKILCDRAMLLEQGRMVEFGEPEKIINIYNYFLARKRKGEGIRIVQDDEKNSAYGSGVVTIQDIRMLNGLREQTEVFISGESCTISIVLKARESVGDITLGILIRDRFGQDLYGTNTHYLEKPIALTAGEQVRVAYHFAELNLGSGKYSVTVAAHKGENHLGECYEWCDLIKTFEVTGSRDHPFIGIIRLSPRVRIQPMVEPGAASG